MGHKVELAVEQHMVTYLEGQDPESNQWSNKWAEHFLTRVLRIFIEAGLPIYRSGAVDGGVVIEDHSPPEARMPQPEEPLPCILIGWATHAAVRMSSGVDRNVMVAALAALLRAQGIEPDPDSTETVLKITIPGPRGADDRPGADDPPPRWAGSSSTSDP